jgi:hypothetical protein
MHIYWDTDLVDFLNHMLWRREEMFVQTVAELNS